MCFGDVLCSMFYVLCALPAPEVAAVGGEGGGENGADDHTNDPNITLDEEAPLSSSDERLPPGVSSSGKGTTEEDNLFIATTVVGPTTSSGDVVLALEEERRFFGLLDEALRRIVSFYGTRLARRRGEGRGGDE